MATHGKDANIDFNFPQDVSANALKDIDKALKTGDGKLTVDALVRYSIAQCEISDENFAPIINRIEATVKKEKDPVYRALLRYFEAILFSNYRANYGVWGRHNPQGEPLPEDYSEWDNDQLNNRVRELISLSLEPKDALLAARVTDHKGLLTYDDMGATLVPTIYQFLCMRNIELLEKSDDSDADKALASSIAKQWVDNTKPGTPEYIYAALETETKSEETLYQENKDNEFGGLPLSHFYASTTHYNDFKDYVSRFPKGFFTSNIRDKIRNIETKKVNLTVPDYISSTEKPKITATAENVNEFTVKIFRVPDGLAFADKNYFDLAELQLVGEKKVSVQGTVPFEKSGIAVEFDPLPFGRYYILPSFMTNGEEQINKKQQRYQQTVVTDITQFNVSGKGIDNIVAAVDRLTGKPKPGVSLVSPRTNQRAKLPEGEHITGNDGIFTVTKKFNKMGFSFALDKDGDRFGPDFSTSPYYEPNLNPHITGNIMTDLAIYRPGETIKFVAVFVYVDRDQNLAKYGLPVRVKLNDANGKEVAHVDGTTDEFGRFEGEIAVPTDRMNGDWILVGSSRDDKVRASCSQRVTVSEYKTPTFTVSFPDARWSFVKNQPVTITGKAETYSGLPVQNTQVRLRLSQLEWSWWWRFSRDNDGTTINDTIINTDDEGKFTITFPPEMFKENTDKYCRWATYNYLLHAEVTTDAGETQQADTKFIIGTRRGIELSNSTIKHNNTKTLKLPLKYNTTDETDTVAVCRWELMPKGVQEPVATGILRTDDPTLDLTKLPSGEYKLKVYMLGKDNEDEDYQIADVYLYKLTDSKPPVDDCPIWAPAEKGSVDKQGKAHFTIGTSTPTAYIYYVARTSEKIVAQGWLTYKPGFHDFSIAVPNKLDDFVRVTFNSVYNGKVYNHEAYMESPAGKENIDLKITSFRNKLTPGDKERWTLTLSDQNGAPKRGAVLLEMIDKAINDIQDNTWSMFYPRSTYRLVSINSNSLLSSSYPSITWTEESHGSYQYHLPELYLYDQEPFGYGRHVLYESAAVGGVMPMQMGNAKRMKAERTEDVMIAAEEADVAFSVADSVEKKSAGTQKKLDEIKLREADIKTALWKPMLTTDDKGNLAVEFEAPEFNTTWVVQALAWSNNLLTDSEQRELVTQKPVMVKSTLPRFVRHGDVATLTANVQNATDQAAKVTAVVELFDPRSGKVYQTRDFTVDLTPKGTQAVGIDWNVPDDIPFVGFRVKAANEQFGDGEQVMLPVLESTQPVIETQPFYIEPKQDVTEITLPKFEKDARITLEYSDNPVWYCVTALPTIFDQNYRIASTLAHSLFALEVAQGVASAQPQIRDAVKYWKEHPEDSTLISMLERNQDLKISTLLASPWVNEADRQTLRMSRLDELFDSKRMDQERKKIMEGLHNLQMGDGGFTWFRYPECRSSLWTTETVLEIVGDIKHLGYLHTSADDDRMFERAVNYMDNEILRQHNERKNKKDYSGYSTYVYVRTLFADVAMKADVKKLFDNALKHMDKHWGDGLSLGEKAFYAMALKRNGYDKTAGRIVESIRQHAINKPELGTYWDNLQTDWRYFDKVAITSTILRAMNECDPKQDEIDNIRKWMLLMKQTNDWGGSSLAADAVYTLLTTGSTWLERNQTPVITIDGTPVEFDKIDSYVGYCRKQIPANSEGILRIQRNGNNPAWGAIYSQFTAKMDDIKQVSIDELSISKEFYVYQSDGTLRPTDKFRVGDRVQVRNVIKNNRDLDFVTIVDERPACAEPVDHFSGTRVADRSWYYLETKDSQTKIFFSDLQKGTHIISYDVFVNAEGEFSAGIASAQCQYAPQIAAHSGSRRLLVEK